MGKVDLQAFSNVLVLSETQLYRALYRVVIQTVIEGEGVYIHTFVFCLRVTFQIKFKLINLKRNLSGKTSIHEYTTPPINVLVNGPARISTTYNVHGTLN